MRAVRGVKCIVAGCQNHTNEGHFVGPLCAPCHEMLTKGRVSEFGATWIHRYRDESRSVGAALVAMAEAIRQNHPEGCCFCSKHSGRRGRFTRPHRAGYICRACFDAECSGGAASKRVLDWAADGWKKP